MPAVNAVLLNGNPKIAVAIASDRLDVPVTSRQIFIGKFDVLQPALRSIASACLSRRAKAPPRSHATRRSSPLGLRPEARLVRDLRTFSNRYPVARHRHQRSLAALPNDPFLIRHQDRVVRRLPELEMDLELHSFFESDPVHRRSRPRHCPQVLKRATDVVTCQPSL